MIRLNLASQYSTIGIILLPEYKKEWHSLLLTIFFRLLDKKRLHFFIEARATDMFFSFPFANIQKQTKILMRQNNA